MSQQVILALIALVAANLPFFSQRTFLFFPLPARFLQKSLALRLAECMVWYGLVGVVAFVLEARAHGTPYPQGWAFYVVTACLFLVFAFPGFVWRYLWRASSPQRHDSPPA